jgi:hypothetical protein
MNTIKTLKSYALYTLLCLVFLTSCEDKENKYPKYRYLVRTTHDNNWTSSAIIRCDSLNMINQTNAILWIDGRKMDLYAPEIRIYDNPYHK